MSGSSRSRRAPPAEPAWSARSTFPRRVVLQVQGVLDAEAGELVVEIGGRFQNEGMQPIAGPGVVVGQTMVDEEWQPQTIRLLDGEGQSVVILAPEAALDPVEHMIAAGGGTSLARS